LVSVYLVKSKQAPTRGHSYVIINDGGASVAQLNLNIQIIFICCLFSLKGPLIWLPSASRARLHVNPLSLHPSYFLVLPINQSHKLASSKQGYMEADKCMERREKCKLKIKRRCGDDRLSKKSELPDACSHSLSMPRRFVMDPNELDSSCLHRDALT
jgi:hypothetical protein